MVHCCERPPCLALPLPPPTPTDCVAQCREAAKQCIDTGVALLDEIDTLLSQSGRLPPAPLEALSKDVDPMPNDLLWCVVCLGACVGLSCHMSAPVCTRMCVVGGLRRLLSSVCTGEAVPCGYRFAGACPSVTSSVVV